MGKKIRYWVFWRWFDWVLEQRFKKWSNKVNYPNGLIVSLNGHWYQTTITEFKEWQATPEKPLIKKEKK